MRYETCDIDLLTLESCHVMPFVWSIPAQSLNWIRLPVPELERLQFSIDRRLKSPNVYVFLGIKGVRFNISNPQKGSIPRPERRIGLMTYCAWGVSIYTICAWACRKKTKKSTKRLCAKLAICPEHAYRCRRSPLKFCMRGHPGGSYLGHFKFHENRLGVSSCRGSKIAIPHWLAPSLASLIAYYRTSRDRWKTNSTNCN